ncbi:MAG: GNAT family N-acetyltransferase [Anaerolineae bacterium]
MYKPRLVNNSWFTGNCINQSRQALIERCLQALRQAGIDKCHLFVFNSNQEAIAFWKSIGWQRRIELSMMSYFTR